MDFVVLVWFSKLLLSPPLQIMKIFSKAHYNVDATASRLLEINNGGGSGGGGGGKGMGGGRRKEGNKRCEVVDVVDVDEDVDVEVIDVGGDEGEEVVEEIDDDLIVIDPPSKIQREVASVTVGATNAMSTTTTTTTKMMTLTKVKTNSMVTSSTTKLRPPKKPKQEKYLVVEGRNEVMLLTDYEPEIVVGTKLRLSAGAWAFEDGSGGEHFKSSKDLKEGEG